MSWLKEECIQSASFYKTLSEWEKHDPASYIVAKHRGWFKECCGHMALPPAKPVVVEPPPAPPPVAVVVEVAPPPAPVVEVVEPPPPVFELRRCEGRGLNRRGRGRRNLNHRRRGADQSCECTRQ